MQKGNCPTNKSFWESGTLFSKRVLALGEPPAVLIQMIYIRGIIKDEAELRDIFFYGFAGFVVEGGAFGEQHFFVFGHCY